MTKKTNGKLKDGTPISDEMIEAMADEAERGYDVDSFKERNRGGRPRLGSAVGISRIGTPRCDSRQRC